MTVDPLTKLIQQDITSSQQSVLWFEALFNTMATTISPAITQPELANGSVSAQQFMSQVQTAQSNGS